MTTLDDNLAEEKGALARLVEKYDLRSERNPSRPFDLDGYVVDLGWQSLIERPIVRLITLGWH
jgi:hypothetical protein